MNQHLTLYCTLSSERVVTHITQLVRFVLSLDNKNPRGFYALLDKMADNDHIKLDNIEIKVYVWV